MPVDKEQRRYTPIPDDVIEATTFMNQKNAQKFIYAVVMYIHSGIEPKLNEKRMKVARKMIESRIKTTQKNKQKSNQIPEKSELQTDDEVQ
jgi:CRISPR/Cas system-associated endonuclease Cas1